MKKTINKTQIIFDLLKKYRKSIFISFSFQTRFWYTGTQVLDGILVINSHKSYLFVHSLDYELAKKTAKNTEIQMIDKNIIAKLKKMFSPKNILIEEEYLLYKDFAFLKKVFPYAKIKKISAQKLRIIKTKEEIQSIKRACKISLLALKKIKKKIKPGIKETDIRNWLYDEMMKLGGEKFSFEAIVVSGKRGSLPHGQPSDKKLAEGDLITIDFGTYYKGYASDITRSFFIGQPKNKKLINLLEAVKKAQKKGISLVKPGINPKEIDNACRSYFQKIKMDKYFIHATGHGLGIDVHELPVVAPRTSEDMLLKPGMVITVEPGIYIPSVGGARMEDDILVTDNGYEILSKL